MINHKSRFFQKIVGINPKEIFGECYIYIEPGGFCIFDKIAPTNWLHFHEFYELCIVTEGIGEYVNGESIFKLCEGDVFIADPGVIHEIRLVKDDKSLYSDILHIVFFRINLRTSANFEFPAKSYEERMLREFITSHAVISRSQKHLFSYLSFLEGYTESASTGLYGLQQIVKNMSLEAMFSLCDKNVSPVEVGSSCRSEYKKQKDYQVISLPVNSILDLSVNFISVNLHRKIYLHEIAALACTSKRNLQYVFKKEFGKTVSDYINIKKTALAASYLKMNFTINDVCNLIAINDAAQFSRLFKRYHGVSPKKYQMVYLSSGGRVYTNNINASKYIVSLELPSVPDAK